MTTGGCAMMVIMTMTLCADDATITAATSDAEESSRAATQLEAVRELLENVRGP